MMMVPTLPLDRVFRGVGRIKKASGTHTPKVHGRIDRMLTELYEDGRLDILRAIKDGSLAPMEVFAAYRAKDLARLPLAAALKPLATEYEAWRVRATKNARSLESRKQSGVYLVRYGKASARVADLPDILLRARVTMESDGHAVTYNRLKSAAQAFVRDTLGKGSALYREISGVARLPEVTTVVRRPMTPRELRDICLASLDTESWAAAWTMANHGMGPGEYWGDWLVVPASGYVQINGTKRSGRVRKVPLLHFPTGGSEDLSRQAFEDRLVKAGAPFKPYDLRRSYANWLEAAGIPRTRRRMYLGHGAKDTTDRYEEHEVLSFLAEDRTALLAYIDRELARPTITLEREG